MTVLYLNLDIVQPQKYDTSLHTAFFSSRRRKNLFNASHKFGGKTSTTACLLDRVTPSLLVVPHRSFVHFAYRIRICIKRLIYFGNLLPELIFEVREIVLLGSTMKDIFHSPTDYQLI